MSNDETTDETNDNSASRRRRVLNWFAGLGVASFALGLIVPLKDLSLAVETGTENDDKSGPKGQRLVFAHEYESEPGGHTHAEGNVVTAEKLTAPGAALVVPEDLAEESKYLILLHKLNSEEIEPPTKSELTDQGFVAYSGICTHLGCTVNWTETSHEVGGPHDHCPCHVGEFDPYRGAEVVGGPAPRPLPQIGVGVNDDNELVLTSDFEAEIGGE